MKKRKRILTVLMIFVFTCGCIFSSFAADGGPGVNLGQKNIKIKAAAGPNGEIYAETHSLYTYTDMESDLNAFRSLYPDLFTVDSLGETVDGRRIYRMTIGDKKAPNHILIFAAMHAREYLTSQLVMKQADSLLKNLKAGTGTYGGLSYQELLKNTAVDIIPMSNPDGVSLSQLGLAGALKTSTREMVQKICASKGYADIDGLLMHNWKNNAEGININRNFDYSWNSEVSSPEPDADQYKGSAAFSTAEAKALAKATTEYPVTRVISYHTQGNIMYWDYEGNADASYVEKQQKLNDAVHTVTGYTLSKDYTPALLSEGGCYKTWACYQGIPCVTIEIGTGGHPVDPAQLPSIYARNESVIPAVLMSLK